MVTNSVEQMKKEKDSFDSFVVETKDGKIVAIAVYSLMYHSWEGKSLYLDDLFVLE